MTRATVTALIAILLASVAGCAPGTLPPLISTSPAPVETGATAPIAAAPSATTPSTLAHVETTLIAHGTTTEVYSDVARRALRCWFGANGALKATHIFNAEAASPSNGGAAEIVVHERDNSGQDPRGNRAFRVTFASNVNGVRVGITPMKLPDSLAQPMIRDVEAWARRGEACNTQLPEAPRAAAPDPPAAPKTKPKTKGAQPTPR